MRNENAFGSLHLRKRREREKAGMAILPGVHREDIVRKDVSIRRYGCLGTWWVEASALGLVVLEHRTLSLREAESLTSCMMAAVTDADLRARLARKP